MCGIFGVSYGPGGSAAEEWTPTEFAQQMFPAIVHRGPHAFGWMSYNPDTGIDIVKHVGKVTDKGNTARIVLDDECKWFVGHVRFATNGAPEYLGNNHPLVHGGVVGVHNGVLKGWEPILKVTGREDPKAEVDSEAIFAAINKWGVKDGLKRIDGNMVTVFTETAHPEVLHIARSYGRPLVYATTPTGALIFASECCVIDACEVEHDEYTELLGRYRHLMVREGKVIAREQYRVDTPAFAPGKGSRQTVAPRSVETGGTHGITDYFDRGRSEPRGTGKGKGRGTRGASKRAAAPRTSLDVPQEYPTGAGTLNGYKDRWGGIYIGAGWMRLPSGECMPVAEYVEWAVKRDLSRIEHEAAAEAAAEYESISRAVERGEGPE